MILLSTIILILGQDHCQSFQVQTYTQLSKLYTNGLISDIDNFVMVVVTPGNNTQSEEDDTLYAITITNESDFDAFGDKYLDAPEIVDRFIYDDSQLPINRFMASSLNEERLVKALNMEESGMTIYRGDTNDLNNWTRLKARNNGTYKRKPL